MLLKPVTFRAAMMVVMAVFCTELVMVNAREARAGPDLGSLGAQAGDGVPALLLAADQPVPGADLLVRLRPQMKPEALRSVLAAGDSLLPLVPELDLYRLRATSSGSRLLSRLQAHPAVLYAEPNYPVRIDAIPNDPDFAWRQWAPQAIKAPEAWDIVTGSMTITIAILDTGIDPLHPDLLGKLVTGTTFVPGTISANDDHGHGTHVAGIAAASTDNGIGMAGISWGACLMPVKVIDRNGVGTYAELINGVYYAAYHGAQIINMSLASDSYSQALQDAINYAYTQGALLVASAGNCALGGSGCTGINPILYPAANNHVISVAATDEFDRRASFSTYNAYVDVAAPGVGIYSTHWQSGISTYFWMNGTSQAAPHVAGLAALVWSGRPYLTNSDVEAIITNTADDVNAATFAGKDQYLGWGRINAYRAVDRTPPTSEVQPLPPGQRDHIFTVSWVGEDDNSGLRHYSIQYRDGDGPWQNWLTAVTITQAVFMGVPNHTYYFQSSATDWAGNVEPFPGGDGDTHIHIATCTISGRVKDNRGVDVAGALLSLDGEGSVAATDAWGRYTLRPLLCEGSYLVSVHRDGFGDVAPRLGVVLTATTALSGLDFVLPPHDNLLRDGNWQFESGELTTTWTITGHVLPTLAPDQGHTGAYAALLGTPMTTTVPGGDSSIAVTVTLPVTGHRPTLSFMYRILTMDNDLHDYFEVRVNGQQVFRDGYTGPDYGTVRDLGWRHGWVEMTPYIGQQVDIRLTVVQGMAYGSYPTLAYVDEVSIGSGSGGRNRIWLPIIVR